MNRRCFAHRSMRLIYEGCRDRLLLRILGGCSDVFRLFMQNLSLTNLTSGTFCFDYLGTRLFLLRCLGSRICRSLDRLVDLVGMLRSFFVSSFCLAESLLCLLLVRRALCLCKGRCRCVFSCRSIMLVAICLICSLPTCACFPPS